MIGARPLKGGETKKARALEAGLAASCALFALEEALGAPNTGLRSEAFKLRHELAILRDRIGQLSDDLSGAWYQSAEDGGK